MASKAFKPAMSANERLKAVSRQLTKASDMEGKVIAITGGASGIGFALAKILATRGAKVSLSDANTVNLYKAAHQLEEYAKSSDYIWAQHADVRDLEQLKEWISQTVKKFGKLDGAANIAGITDCMKPEIPWHDARDDDSLEQLLAINLVGVANSMKAELAAIQPGGSIVNATSVAGLDTRAGTVSYVTAKHGVVGLTRAIARRYGREKGIRVNAVAPGLIHTPLLTEFERKSGIKEAVATLAASVPLPRVGDAEEAAKVFAFLLSDDASYVSGAVYTVDGGMTA
ncbi:hypothetical protein AC579_9895 [Pseudocercospora musae]|uniref:Uncharacterized protein n=1 Tax=Pseudocercospora musae TaxID=113226 RepID=A0A139GYL9_9PEZI|nr:hypothetical protein AC579_9895 [Pseudocercospora musae]